jgi:hypothetical protein
MKRRCVPGPSKSVVLPRDIEALKLLAWARVLTTTQFRVVYPTRRIRQRRLRSLLDRKLCRAALDGEGLHRDNVYALTPAGARLLADHGVADDLARPGRFPNPRALRHALAIRDVLVAFLIAEQARSLVLADFLFSGDLARVAAFQESRLTPDAVAVIEGREPPRQVAIEVDLGTEALSVVREKLVKYRDLLARAAVHDVVFVTHTVRRRLEAMVTELGLAESVRVVGAADLATITARYSHGPVVPAVRAVCMRRRASSRAEEGDSARAPVAFRASDGIRRCPGDGGARHPLLLRVTRDPVET